MLEVRPRPKAASPACRDWSWPGSKAASRRGCRGSAAPPAATILRSLKEHGPGTAVRVERMLFCKDWINLQLTGNLATDFSDASIPLFDRACTNEAFDQLDVAELKGQARAASARHRPYRFAPAGRRRRPRPSRRNSRRDRCDRSRRDAMVNIVIPLEPCAGEPIGTMICHPFDDRWIRAVAPPVDWFASLHRLIGARGAPRLSTGAFLDRERAPFGALQASGFVHRAQGVLDPRPPCARRWKVPPSVCATRQCDSLFHLCAESVTASRTMRASQRALKPLWKTSE
jgi:hypothetical protein